MLELVGVFSEIFAGEAFDLRLGDSIEDFSDELSFKLGDFLKGASFFRPAPPDLPPPRGGSGP